MQIAHLALGGLGLLYIALALPMMYGKIKPNRWYGFRTKKTLSDETVWYKANRVGGVDLMISGIVIAVCSLALFIASTAVHEIWLLGLNFGIFVVAVLISVTHSLLVVRKM